MENRLQGVVTSGDDRRRREAARCVRRPDARGAAGAAGGCPLRAGRAAGADRRAVPRVRDRASGPRAARCGAGRADRPAARLLRRPRRGRRVEDPRPRRTRRPARAAARGRFRRGGPGDRARRPGRRARRRRSGAAAARRGRHPAADHRPGRPGPGRHDAQHRLGHGHGMARHGPGRPDRGGARPDRRPRRRGGGRGRLGGLAGLPPRHAVRRPVGRLHADRVPRPRHLPRPGRRPRPARRRPRRHLSPGRRLRRQRAHPAPAGLRAITTTTPYVWTPPS